MKTAMEQMLEEIEQVREQAAAEVRGSKDRLVNNKANAVLLATDRLKEKAEALIAAEKQKAKAPVEKEKGNAKG